MYAEDVTAAHSKMLARERTFIKRPTVGFDAGAGTSDSHATCGNFGHIKQVDTIKQNVSQSDDSFKLERGTTRKNTHSLSGEQGAGDEEDDVEAAAGLQEPSSFNQGLFSRQLPTEGRPAAVNASFCPRPAVDASFGQPLRRPSFCGQPDMTRSRMLRSQKTVNNLLTMEAGVAQVKPASAFKSDVEKIRKRIQTIDRRVINPRSLFIRVWDLITVAALLFTAFVTPFEVAFFGSGVYSGPINFTLNRLVDLIFTLDIVLNFFLPYRASQKDGGMLVFDNYRIVKNYLRTWFPLDLFASKLQIDRISC